MHTRDYVKAVFANEGLYRKPDAGLQSFLASLDDAPADCWPEFIERFRREHYDLFDTIGGDLADEVLVQVAYAIGVPDPVSIDVDTRGTGRIPDGRLSDVIQKVFDLRPRAIVERLDLLEPRYEDDLITQNAQQSDPGRAFLLWTIDAKGEDGYLDYWSKLADNGVRVLSDWEPAYNAYMNGEAAMVVSYSTDQVYYHGEDVDMSRHQVGFLNDQGYANPETMALFADSDSEELGRRFMEFVLRPEIQAGIAQLVDLLLSLVERLLRALHVILLERLRRLVELLLYLLSDLGRNRTAKRTLDLETVISSGIMTRCDYNRAQCPLILGGPAKGGGWSVRLG